MKAGTSLKEVDKVCSFAPRENTRRCVLACLTDRLSRVMYQTQSYRKVVGMVVV